MRSAEALVGFCASVSSASDWWLLCNPNRRNLVEWASSHDALAGTGLQVKEFYGGRRRRLSAPKTRWNWQILSVSGPGMLERNALIRGDSFVYIRSFCWNNGEFRPPKRTLPKRPASKTKCIGGSEV